MLTFFLIQSWKESWSNGVCLQASCTQHTRESKPNLAVTLHVGSADIPVSLLNVQVNQTTSDFGLLALRCSQYIAAPSSQVFQVHISCPPFNFILHLSHAISTSSTLEVAIASGIAVTMGDKVSKERFVVSTEEMVPADHANHNRNLEWPSAHLPMIAMDLALAVFDRAGMLWEINWYVHSTVFQDAWVELPVSWCETRPCQIWCFLATKPSSFTVHAEAF